MGRGGLEPPPDGLLSEMIAAGTLGRKSGSGGKGRTGFGNTGSKGTDNSHAGYEDPHTGHLSGPGALSAM